MFVDITLSLPRPNFFFEGSKLAIIVSYLILNITYSFFKHFRFEIGPFLMLMIKIMYFKFFRFLFKSPFCES